MPDSGAYLAMEGGGGGLGLCLGLCRVMGPPLGLCCGTVRNGACTRMSVTCVTCVTYAGCATMTRRGGGGFIGKSAAKRVVTWVSSSAVLT